MPLANRTSNTNAPSVWFRSSDNALRTPNYSEQAVNVVVTRSGFKAFAVSLTSSAFYVFEIGSDQSSVRLYDGKLTTLALAPDESRVIVGLDNNSLVISDRVAFEDVVYVPHSYTSGKFGSVSVS